MYADSNKTSNALNSFCSAVRSSRAAAAAAATAAGRDPVVPLEQRPVVDIDGASPDILVVLQREVGAIAAPPPVGSASSAVATTSRTGPSKICSIDATTCLIAAFTNPATGAVAVAHIDAPAQCGQGVAMMLRLLRIRAPAAAAGAEQVDAAAAAIVVRVALLGAVTLDKFSPETLSTMLRALIEQPNVVFDLGDGNNTAVWALNSDPATGSCLRRGMMIDARTGAVSCVECQGANRGYPDARLRTLRGFSNDASLSSVSLFQGEEIAVHIAKPKVEVVGDDAASSQSSTSVDSPVPQQQEQPGGGGGGEAPDSSSIFKVIVRAFAWHKFAADVASRPLSWFLKLSTTPTMEPADFAESFKACVVYGNCFSPKDVFGVTNRPHMFTISEEGKWAQI